MKHKISYKGTESTWNKCEAHQITAYEQYKIFELSHFNVYQTGNILA